ncbi:hypothetical protein Hanom_Chr08g00759041 [Helianthus anomalus]
MFLVLLSSCLLSWVKCFVLTEVACCMYVAALHQSPKLTNHIKSKYQTINPAEGCGCISPHSLIFLSMQFYISQLITNVYVSMPIKKRLQSARRRRGRTPTPGRYLGLRTVHVRRRSPTYSPYSRSRSPSYSSERSRSYSPDYTRRRSTSPYSRRRSYSPTPDDYRRRSRRRSRSYTPEDRYYRSRGRYHSRDYSPDYRSSSRYYSPDYRRYRSVSRSVSPPPRRDYRSRSVRYRRVSRSVSSSPRRHYRSYSSSMSPVRGHSPSVSPRSPSRSYSSGSSRSASPSS